MLDLIKPMLVAASGMRAQSERMKVISENIANANSTPETPEGDPYRRQIPTFRAQLDRELGVKLVSMPKTVADDKDFGMRYDPSHPAADEKGYVKLPNVNTLIESMDMREAQKSYEANLNVIDSMRRMMSRTIELLRA
ncbi:MAG: flagellar basal body rod protein FlgC [Alphaproteobacteria bacterium]|nr:flagellar basal body rod protein FlgC [Alphaproteobacteria bacterium]